MPDIKTEIRQFIALATDPATCGAISRKAALQACLLMKSHNMDIIDDYKLKFANEIFILKQNGNKFSIELEKEAIIIYSILKEKSNVSYIYWPNEFQWSSYYLGKPGEIKYRCASIHHLLTDYINVMRRVK